ncbi:MAG TPA: hypothetical protein VJQ52_02050, partial [Steroidobacteraceae bacterium]|nr:hypothetical protein [Steroidobacteraceae bacterium]
LIPGLVDMHAHVAGDVLDEKGQPGDRWDREAGLSFLRTLLQFGVTTVSPRSRPSDDGRQRALTSIAMKRRCRSG